MSSFPLSQSFIYNKAQSQNTNDEYIKHLWKGQEGIKMGSIVEAAIYEYISKFFLIFVVVPVGIMVLGHIIYIIVEVINEIRKK